MRITRRNALRGATAAAVVTGAITAPLAIKAALAGEPGGTVIHPVKLAPALRWGLSCASNRGMFSFEKQGRFGYES